MAFWGMLPVIGTVIKKGLDIVDKLVPDKELRDKLKQELMLADYSSAQEEMEAKTKIILAEIQGQSWLQRNWRPILMLTIVAIVANNYLLFPYLSLFTDKVILLELPDKLWNLMTIGVGGYIVGRSAEKGVEAWKKK